MRTMLILVLLCSLAQLAISTDPRDGVPREAQAGCGTYYACYVPEWCTRMDRPTLTASNVIDLSSDTIFTNCPAIIKFHPYGIYWMQVTIESLAETTKYIILKLSDARGRPKAEFSCKPDGPTGLPTGLEGSYTIHTSTSTSVGGKGPSPLAKKIKCDFEAKVMRSEQIIDFINIQKVQLEVNYEISPNSETTETTKTTKPNLQYKFCDPSYLTFTRPEIFNNRKLYKKVDYKPEGASCELNYKMEYKPEGAAEYLDDNVQLTCDYVAGLFAIGATQFPEKDSIEIRCVADAKFFCKDVVKEDVDVTKGKMGLERTPPNPSPGQAMELKCPVAYPHLYVAGKPKRDMKIECLNYGVEASWDIGGTQLTTVGPEVHCEKTIPCELIRKITGKSVRKGSVGDDRLPKCSEGGTLYVDNQKVVPKSPRCDETTGDYKYTIGSEEKIVDETTIFECQYPPKGPTMAEKMNEANESKMQIGAIIGCIIAFLIVGGTIFVMTFFARRKLKKEFEKERKEAEARNKAAFLNFGHKPNSNAPAAPELNENTFSWNKLMMSYRYLCKEALFAGEEAVKIIGEEGEKGFEERFPDKTSPQPKGKAIKRDAWPVTKANKEFNVEMDKAYSESTSEYLPKKNTGDEKKNEKKQ